MHKINQLAESKKKKQEYGQNISILNSHSQMISESLYI